MARQQGEDLPTPQEWAILKDKLDGATAAAKAAEVRGKALDESFTAVWARLKELEQATPAAAAEEPTDAEEEEEAEPPRDWLTVDDVEKARLWLKELQEWVGSTYRWLPKAGTLTLPRCWPWHHAVVQELIAVQECRVASYEAGGTAVADFLLRWWPTALERITEELAGKCSPELHREGTKVYEADPGQVSHLAAWWVESRELVDRPGLTELV